jgi:hypothetical protein
MEQLTLGNDAATQKTGMLRCLEVEFLSLSASCFAVSSICAAQFSNMCSTNSRKLQLRCGCQFPWCATALTVALCWYGSLPSSGKTQIMFKIRALRRIFRSKGEEVTRERKTIT